MNHSKIVRFNIFDPELNIQTNFFKKHHNAICFISALIICLSNVYIDGFVIFLALSILTLYFIYGWVRYKNNGTVHIFVDSLEFLYQNKINNSILFKDITEIEFSVAYNRKLYANTIRIVINYKGINKVFYIINLNQTRLLISIISFYLFLNQNNNSSSISVKGFWESYLTLKGYRLGQIKNIDPKLNYIFE